MFFVQTISLFSVPMWYLIFLLVLYPIKFENSPQQIPQKYFSGYPFILKTNYIWKQLSASLVTQNYY